MQNGAVKTKWCEKFSHHFFFAMRVATGASIRVMRRTQV